MQQCRVLLWNGTIRLTVPVLCVPIEAWVFGYEAVFFFAVTMQSSRLGWELRFNVLALRVRVEA